MRITLYTFTALVALVAFSASAKTLSVHLTTDLPADFLPEGVEWDAGHHRFLISSIRQNRIAAVHPVSGKSTPFATAPGSVLGLHIDAAGKTLWAVWTRFGHAFKQNESSGLAQWSLEDGKSLGQWPLPDKSANVNLGDLTIVDPNTIIASDSGTGVIWRFDIRAHRFSQLVLAGRFKSPQGLVPGKQSGTIYLADYSTGLWRIALKDGNAEPLAAPADTELRGIDGLYRSGDRLIAVQNGTQTPRLLAVEMNKDDSISNVKRIVDLFDEEPSLGTVTDNAFWFVSNGQWSQYDDDLKPKRNAALEAPELFALPLSELNAKR